MGILHCFLAVVAERFQGDLDNTPAARPFLTSQGEEIRKFGKTFGWCPDPWNKTGLAL